MGTAFPGLDTRFYLLQRNPLARKHSHPHEPRRTLRFSLGRQDLRTVRLVQHGHTYVAGDICTSQGVERAIRQ